MRHLDAVSHPTIHGLDDLDPATRPPAVVLLLHGGRARSYEPVRRGNAAALRISLLAWSLRADRADRRIPVLTLRYRLRGWNDEDGTRTPDPVLDAFAALELIERRLGRVPVILIGHSLGGRTALRVAGHPCVRAVAALAPWLPIGEPVAALGGRGVLIAHGRRDRVTDIEHSIAFASRCVGVADAVYLRLVDDGHAMLRAAPIWHRLARDFVALSVYGPDAANLQAERLDGGDS